MTTTTTTLTDTQVRVLDCLRQGWRARQALTAHGEGLGEHGRVRLVPPGRGCIDYVSVITLRKLEDEGLVQEVRDADRREWQLTALAWHL